MKYNCALPLELSPYYNYKNNERADQFYSHVCRIVARLFEHLSSTIFLFVFYHFKWNT